MTQSIQDLREKHDALAKESRNLIDNNSGDKWTQEIADKVDANNAECDRLESQIRRMEEVNRIEAAQIGDAIQVIDADEIEDGAALKPLAVDAAWIRGGWGSLTPEQTEVARALQKTQAAVFGQQATTPGSAGGYLTSVEHSRMLLEEMKSFGGMREVSQIVSTGTGNQIDWPTIDETAQKGEIIAENAPANAGDMTFGTTNIGAYKYSSKIVTVSIELLQDSLITGPSLVEYINRALVTRVARITNEHFTTGTGTGQPQGVVTGSAQGLKGATSATPVITYEDLVNLEHSVDPAYRSAPSTRWMFHDSMLRDIKKLKDSQGLPLWNPAIMEMGQPANVLGYQYTINQDMPVPAVDAKSILFGDFSKYLIRDVLAVTLFRFEDSNFMLNGQVGFMSWSRHDGKVIDATSPTNAIKHFEHGAAA